MVLIKLTSESSETKQKTLEEIAAAFGDKVVLVDDMAGRDGSLNMEKSSTPDAKESGAEVRHVA